MEYPDDFELQIREEHFVDGNYNSEFIKQVLRSPKLEDLEKYEAEHPLEEPYCYHTIVIEYNEHGDEKDFYPLGT